MGNLSRVMDRYSARRPDAPKRVIGQHSSRRGLLGHRHSPVGVYGRVYPSLMGNPGWSPA